MTPAQRLRELLAKPGILMMPGFYDGLTAKLTADAGYRLGFMSGFAVAAARLGMPDTGLISFTEMVDTLRNCCTAAPGLPIVGDGDTGYGNALNVQRTVVEYARAGAAAVMIEDQVSPKKCGHTKGKQVVSREEARMKIRAAAEAARRADILVLARTDARAVYDFDEALARCRDFAAEGADIVFLEAPESAEEMREFCRAIPKPCMANMVPGGKTPILPTAELERIGYRIVTYPVA
ncbi:MAG: isocitrate lyase/PEP mutase family protein, partial [Rhodospirillales bacterium]|nr:isocitrate lyase/PEP mutase family protein [Rhodospirillales bacterium]